MLEPVTLPDLFSASSSPVLAVGATPCALPDGPRTDLFGRAVAPANPSAQPVPGVALQTSGTFGLPGSTSSASADLTLSLVSKLTQRLDTEGSTLFNLTWKEKVTPAGRSVSLLRASARRTSGNDCGSWLTPNANEDAAGSLRGNMQRMLTHQAKERDPEGCATGMQLNANLARWLMGIPADWHNCAPTAMPSSRKSRKSS